MLNEFVLRNILCYDYIDFCWEIGIFIGQPSKWLNKILIRNIHFLLDHSCTDRLYEFKLDVRCIVEWDLVKKRLFILLCPILSVRIPIDPERTDITEHFHGQTYLFLFWSSILSQSVSILSRKNTIEGWCLNKYPSNCWLLFSLSLELRIVYIHFTVNVVVEWTNDRKKSYLMWYFLSLW